MWSFEFLKAIAERAVKSFTGGIVAFWGTDVLNIVEADWGEASAIGAGAAVVSVLLSISSSAVTSSPGPSLNNAEVLTPKG